MRSPDPPKLSRAENLVSWFGAALLVTGGVIYTLNAYEKARRQPPERSLPNPTPAQEPLMVQDRRAREPGRGRDARAPVHIPWRGWKDIVVRTYQESMNDRVFLLAASVVFYSIVALFPAIAAAVSSYALFADASTIGNHVAIVSDIVPQGALDLMQGEISRIASKSDGRLTIGFLIGLAIALWSANAGMKAIFDALNVIYDEEEKRGLIWLNVESLFFTVCAIACLLLALGAVVVFPLFLATFGLTSMDEPLIGLLRWPAMFLLVVFGVSVLYRYGPSRRRPKWRWISIGSVFAGLAWLAVSSLFSFYLANFANYNATYGALGAVVGVMMWMWFCTVVVLMGAQLNAEIEHQTACDSTVGPDAPLGARGAVMADTVGAAKA
jgi:membrane protein